jgi:hypothetical protein
LRQKLYYDFLLSICEILGENMVFKAREKVEVIVEAKAIL